MCVCVYTYAEWTKNIYVHIHTHTHTHTHIYTATLVIETAKICLQCRRPGSIPGLGRSPWEGNGNPFQYSCLENPTDREAWQAIGHGVTKSQTQQKWLSMAWHICSYVSSSLFHLLSMPLSSFPFSIPIFWEVFHTPSSSSNSWPYSFCDYDLYADLWCTTHNWPRQTDGLEYYQLPNIAKASTKGEPVQQHHMLQAAVRSRWKVSFRCPSPPLFSLC